MKNRSLNQTLLTGIYFGVSLINLAGILGVLFLITTIPSPGFYFNGSYVGFVDPFGPAADILQRNDRIISANGIPAEGIIFIDTFNNLLRREPTITLDIERVVASTDIAEIFSVTIPVVSPSWLDIIIQSNFIVVGLSFWVAGVLPLFYRSADPLRHIFFFFCQAWALFMARINDAFLITDLFGFDVTASINFLAPIWALVFFNHLHLFFPRPLFHRRLRHIWMGAIYAGAIGITLYVIFNSPAAYPTRTWSLMQLNIVYGLIGVLGLTVYAYAKTPLPQRRRPFGFIVLGAAVGLLPLIFSSILAEITSISVISHEFTAYFLVVLPLTYAYAIWHHQAIKLERYASRSSVIFITILLLAALYLSGYALVKRWFSPQTAASLPTGLLLTLLVVLVYRPLRARVQIWVDKTLLGGWYDYQTVVEQVISRVANAEGKIELAQQLAATVQQVMGLKWVALLLPDEEGSVKAVGIAGDSKVQADLAPVVISTGAATMQFFADKIKPYSVEEIKVVTGALQREDNEDYLLSYPELRLLIAVQSHEDSIGLLALGPKLNGDVFNADDLRILHTVVWQAGAVLQNARLVKDLEKKSAESEQYQRQYLHIRREEQKRLARELHDQVIQALVGLNYRLADWRDNHARMALSPQFKEQLNGFAATTSDLIDTTRVLCRYVRPPALDLGLPSALRSLANRLEELHDMEIVFRISGKRDIDINEDTADCLYQCAQEALTNVHKHVKEPRASLSLALQEDVVTVVVEDSGPGFDLPPRLAYLMEENHFGVMGMRERVELVGGVFLISSSPQQGTRVEIKVPPGGYQTPDQLNNRGW